METKRTAPYHQKEATVLNRATLGVRGAAEHDHTIPWVFISVLDQANQELTHLSSIFGRILSGHGNPTKDDILKGLRGLQHH